MSESPNALFHKICQFSKDYPPIKGGLPVGDPRTRKIVADLKSFGQKLASALEERSCSGFETAVSEGHGAFPRYTWICFLPPGQKVSEGVYAGICFDGKGSGGLAGCLKSVTRGTVAVKTLKRPPEAKARIDVGDFNNAFVNPEEFSVTDFNFEKLAVHLAQSLQTAKEIVAQDIKPSTGSTSKVLIPLSGSPAFVAAIAKPFLILTGNSGTGKTKLAERLAETYRDDDDSKKAGNYAMVAVGADWTDNRSVVGFVNHLREASLENPKDKRPVYQSTPILDLLLHADQHKDWPHFLILDEMNLSHVERYFADFLSAMEAREGVLRLHSEGPADQPDYRLPRSDGDKIGVPRQLAYPESLFVIGTVNVDETTYMFSPKVLDRAHVVEFEVDPKAIAAFLEKPEPLLPAPRAPDSEAFGFLQLSKDARAIDGGSVEPLPPAVAVKITAHLMAVLRILQRGRFEFAFRTANEVNTYLRVCRQLADDKSAWESGGWKTDLDDEILQKILPRLHGSRARVGNLVGALVCYFATGEEAEALQFFPAEGQEEAVKTLTDAIILAPDAPEFPRCFKKMQIMARVLVEEQFVSFIC
jgi:hypothetical protein